MSRLHVLVLVVPWLWPAGCIEGDYARDPSDSGGGGPEDVGPGGDQGDLGPASRDAGDGVRDAGGPPVDSGSPPADSGSPPTDSGSPPTDSGSPPTDSGSPPADSGSPPADAGPEDPGINPGWIGGACAGDGDCPFAGGTCLGTAAGWPGGTCTQACDRYCPDQEGDLFTVTFCVEGEAGTGQCVSRCDFTKLEEGCRPGYSCVRRGRYQEPEVTNLVCLPTALVGPGDGPGPCLEEALRLGLSVTPAPSVFDHPEGRPDLTCTVEEPLYLASPVLGANYRYMDAASPARMFMACPLALALHDLGEVLAESGILEVIHMGVHNCRAMRDSDNLSQHALAQAIDFGAFVAGDGTVYSVEHDWESLRGETETEKGAWLQAIAHRMYDDRIFNIILTPDYNAIHYNHFHVDLTPGSHYLGKPGVEVPRFLGTFAEWGDD